MKMYDNYVPYGVGAMSAACLRAAVYLLTQTNASDGLQLLCIVCRNF